MHRNALEIGDGLGPIRGRLLVLRRIHSKHGVDVAPDVLEFYVRDREGADVTTGASERNPRRGRILTALVEHFRQPVRQYIGPVGERVEKACDTVVVEQSEAVADRDPEFVAVNAG